MYINTKTARRRRRRGKRMSSHGGNIVVGVKVDGYEVGKTTCNVGKNGRDVIDINSMAWYVVVV
jgi:hypothetical protein